MTGTALLDAAIGVVFVILSFSLMASALNEALATALNWRGRMLRRGLFRLLEGAAGVDLVDRAFPGQARMRAARLTRAVLSDPAIRVLHGPRGALARAWDMVAGGRRSVTEREAARAGRLPSAIPADSFARALIDALVRQVDLSAVEPGAQPTDAAALRALIGRLEREARRRLCAADGPLASLMLSPEMKERLRQAVGRLSAVREVRARLDGWQAVQAELSADVVGVIHEADFRLHGLLKDLGAWFDRAMERVSGWYVRRARLALFLLGVALAGLANVELTALGGRILTDDATRAALVTRAEGRVETGLPAGRPGREVETIDDLAAEIGAAHDRLTDLPGYGGPGLGRACAPDEGAAACVRRSFSLSALISWLLIGLGCTMGGQFWYDFLGSLLRFRPGAAAVRRAAPGA